jgi:uncharacterized protein (DUF885 family)
MTILRRTFMALLAGGFAACASSRREADDGERLERLLADSDEAYLARNPIDALFRGDYRFAAQHGNWLTDAYVEAERSAAVDELKRLAAIDRDKLDATIRLACDCFRWQREITLRSLAPDLAPFRLCLEPDHFDGWHLFFPELSSGRSVAPYASVKDYENGLSRIDGFVGWLGTARERLREGAARGIVHPRLVAEHLVNQFDGLATQGLENSPFYEPIRRWPSAVPPAARERLATAYAAAIGGSLSPAFAAMRDFLKHEYLPRTRSSIGMSALPGGEGWYRHLIAEHTTTGLTPEQIHAMGLGDMVRIRQGMQQVMSMVSFDGTLPQFLQHLRTDARFRPVSANALADGYRTIGLRVNEALPRLFRHQPRTPLEIRPTPEHQAPTDAGARYQPGTPDGSSPGIFYFNTHNLASRSTFDMETLYLHEAVPGHHFQNMLAAENRTLPAMLRFGGNTAYAEGWALYAESLGPELGLFTDPFQRFGSYDDEMLRAMRLVVDTGIHAMGWTREQAIEFMLSHSAMSRGDATAEVERYIAVPAQALAYKVGQITITRLRREAEAALGARFDVRDFHEQVLMTGALPLTVLEAKIDGWVAGHSEPSRASAKPSLAQ